MILQRGGFTVQQGTFWNIANGQRVDIDTEGVLPGDRNTRYLRLPSGALLALGPVVGFLYVVMLPFIGIVTIGSLVVDRTARGIVSLVGKSISFGWRPRTAYLSGRKKEKRGK